ncbi:MAG: ABC-2 family transporter protein [ANME-2 cluster archaeon HR1]|nr:MAG: ABC-2 family transporter protein [ANME-2 cluster archaeon HR1]
MVLLNRSLIVARFEFLKIVKRKQFLLITFGFPIFFLLIMAIPMMANLMVFDDDPDLKSIGYIDQTGLFNLSSKNTAGSQVIVSVKKINESIEFIQYTGNEEAEKAIISKTISSYIIIPDDYLQNGTIELYSTNSGFDFQEMELSAQLSEIIITTLLTDKVDDDTLGRIIEPVDMKLFTIDTVGDVKEKGISDIIGDFALPFITGMLLIITIFSASGYLLRGVAEEKETRVIEIILSSLTPRELLTGKIIGLGCVGLLQITIWISIGTMGSIYVLPVVIKPLVLLLAFVYFILGFLLFASIMAGVGAISGSMQEAQQLVGIFTFIAIAPMMFMQVLITKPDGAISTFLSLFPLTSPVAMMSRIAVSDVPVYQIAASILILIVSVYFVIILSSRLFRVGLLMYGKRPDIRTIVQYMR